MGLLVECPNPECGKLNGQRALAKAKAEGRQKLIPVLIAANSLTVI